MSNDLSNEDIFNLFKLVCIGFVLIFFGGTLIFVPKNLTIEQIQIYKLTMTLFFSISMSLFIIQVLTTVAENSNNSKKKGDLE
jgi:hypothetical protein